MTFWNTHYLGTALTFNKVHLWDTGGNHSLEFVVFIFFKNN